jgi:YidC/Oxa1 family membrane protein insertase
MEFLNPVYEAIAWVLAQIYSVIPNLGVSIILLTCIIMLILYPLTAKQAKSMIAMQRVQPEIKKLQAKYKGDRQKLNEEMMKFYQENKINPLAGCLPLLVQLPIFFSLFQVLRNPQKYVPKDSSLYHALCDGANCAKDQVNHLKFLGMDLQLSATDAHSSIINAAPYFLLVGLVILTGFLQTRQAQKRTPAANKQMGMVMRVLPIFFGLISLSFPSGLVLYFFVSNLWRLGQQEVIFRRHGSAMTPVKAKDTKAAAIDASSRLVDEEPDVEDAEVVEDEGPKPIMPAKRQPPARSESSAAAAKPAETKAKATRGLRGLFALPPPPEGNSGGGAGAATRPAKPTSSGASRPPQQRKRNKKKRKR